METSVLDKGTVPEIGATEIPTCQHVWLIDSPAGPSSNGVCRACGETKEFPNYIEGSAWGYDMSVEQLGGASRVGVAKRGRAKSGLAEDE